jgi:hypothetical protein
MTAIATVAAATVTAAKKQQSTKSCCSGKSGDDDGGRGERREAARAARAASIYKKMQTGAHLVLVTRHDHIKEIVPQIVPRIVTETSSKKAIFFGGFQYYFGTICGTGNSTRNSTKIILQQNEPKYSRLTLPWILVRLRALFMRFSVLGVGQDPRAALPSAWWRSICYPQHSAGGEAALPLRCLPA